MVYYSNTIDITKRIKSYQKYIDKKWCELFFNFIIKHFNYDFNTNSKRSYRLRKEFSLSKNIINVKKHKKIFYIDNDNVVNNIIIVDIIKDNPNFKWDWWSLSSVITFDLLIDNLHKPFNWNELSDNLKISWKNIKEHSNLNWNWSILSRREDITLEDILQNHNLPWNWEIISLRDNLKWEQIINHIDKKWDWYVLSRRDIITWDIIKNNPKLPWKMSEISKNSNINYKIIEENPSYKWEYAYFSYNENLTFEIIEKNLNKNWNLTAILNNPFKKDKETFIIKYYRKYLSAYRIQLYWKRCRYNPEYLICQNIQTNMLLIENHN